MHTYVSNRPLDLTRLSSRTAANFYNYFFYVLMDAMVGPKLWLIKWSVFISMHCCNVQFLLEVSDKPLEFSLIAVGRVPAHAKSLSYPPLTRSDA